ncbi:hypothetical protein [Alicyclobacillus cellulosilyticus]|uniref:hypothetical protein n=1 Tax=Alicyclobacillus cellulosilyticus TaxID=1003997 RepID=UPI0016693FAB|nr:hypothetical protein [Alicyclobacillus cellulosilyticus]
MRRWKFIFSCILSLFVAVGSAPTLLVLANPVKTYTIQLNGKTYATSSYTEMNKKIYVQASTVSNLLTRLGIQNKINTSKHEWTIVTGLYDNQLRPAKTGGGFVVQVNGSVVERGVQSISLRVQSSVVKQLFFPLQSVQAVLDHIGFSTDVWSMKGSWAIWKLAYKQTTLSKGQSGTSGAQGDAISPPPPPSPPSTSTQPSDIGTQPANRGENIGENTDGAPQPPPPPPTPVQNQ